MEKVETMSFGIRVLQPNQMRCFRYGLTYRDAFNWKCGSFIK
jgi:hypothetical protein